MKYVMDHEGKPYRKFFEEICAIPHESFNEKQVSDYIVAFAKERGLWYHQDKIWNVIVKKPASPGYENHPPIMIQGHTDMVCEKAPGSKFNFDTDPLELYVEDGFLKAKDTTLGADCGHGIAYMLAILDDKSLKHPPLEMFFSVQEEAGIGGPRLADYSHFSPNNKILINTDCMFEGGTYVSTANVVGGDFVKNVRMVKNTLPACTIRVGGLFGGHAAMNMYRDQANSIKTVTRVVFQLMKEYGVGIASVKGGTIRNNIPTDASVTVTGQPKALERAKEIVKELDAVIRNEYSSSDPEFYIVAEAAAQPEMAADEFSSRGIIRLLQALPTGAVKRSLETRDFVLGSRNMGTVSMEDGRLVLGYMFRSAYKSLIADFMDQSMLIAEAFGAVYQEEYRYGGYTTSLDTPIIKLYQDVYKKATGKDLTYIYIHGGTDAGTIIDSMGGMDTIAIGPNTYEYHRPGERLDLASFDRCYGYLLEIISRL